MVLRKLLGDPPPGTCRYCHQKTGFLSWYHKQCRDFHTAGIQEMVQLAAQAAAVHTFNEAALRQTLRPSPSAPEPPNRTSSRPWRRPSGRESPRR